MKADLYELIENLAIKPTMGMALGNNFFKIRLAISSKAKGKSAGARVITFVKISNSIVILTAIYDKSEKITISNLELEQIFNQLP